MDAVNWIEKFLINTWSLTSEMAPYLLLGFVMAGLLQIFFNEEWVRRHLGQRGFRQIVKACLIGIPLPLCSCGVIPVAAGIRRQGGQRGAVAAFTASTPQTGVDSIFATVGMLGWVFAIVRVCIAFVNGIVAGVVVEKLEEDGQRTKDEGLRTKDEGQTCCGSEESSDRNSSFVISPSSFVRGLRFGLVTLPSDLFWALTVGLLIAGMIATFAPADLFANLPGGRFSLYVVMTLISLPLYVCSTGSIPMAFSFLQAGMSPGAVLIFLIAGPASNMATVTSLWKLIGGKATVGYILSIIGTCWAVAIFIDFSGISLLVNETMHHHDTGVNLFQQVMAGVLILLLVGAKVLRRR